jgi:hypothetical protein
MRKLKSRPRPKSADRPISKVELVHRPVPDQTERVRGVFRLLLCKPRKEERLEADDNGKLNEER